MRKGGRVEDGCVLERLEKQKEDERGERLIHVKREL